MAVAHCKRGAGMIKVNGAPIEYLQPQGLRSKVLEPLLLLGNERFADVDIRVRVKGGGYTSQVYAIRQAISKALVAYYQKCEYSLIKQPATPFPPGHHPDSQQANGLAAALPAE